MYIYTMGGTGSKQKTESKEEAEVRRQIFKGELVPPHATIHVDGRPVRHPDAYTKESGQMSQFPNITPKKPSGHPQLRLPAGKNLFGNDMFIF